MPDNNNTGRLILKATHKKKISVNPLPVPPTITGFSPSSGPVGTSVIISGINFNTTIASNIVFFGATRATITQATATSLTVIVPVGATYQPISVLNSDTQLTGYSASPFTITFSPNSSTVTNANFFSQLDLSPRSSSTAQYMTTADLDGDGKADIVSINSDATTNNVSIFRNVSSSGTLTAVSFNAKIELPVDGAPAGIAIGDLNGDGKPEIITLDAGKVSFFRNTSTNGNISFDTKIDFPILNGVSISVGDLDNDGKADVVVSDRKDGTVFVFRNTSTAGNLSFANAIPAATFTTGGPESVAIGDLDRDGKADMAVPNKVSGFVSVFPNISTPGNIAFGTAIVLTAGTKPVKVALGDFNADGRPDLVVANSASSNVSVFQNTSSVGNISFAAKADLPGDTKTATVAVGDIDGDGKLDIVSVAVNGGGMVSLFRNIYTSGTISVSSFASKSLLNSLLDDVTIGDIDGDGRPDLAGTNQKVLTVLRFNPFKTKVSDSFISTTLARIDSAIRADVVTSATTYRFRVTQGLNVQTIDTQTNSFKLTQLASYAYSTAYSIDVQVLVGGSWSDYGAIGVVTTPAPLTQISASFRSKTLASIDSAITADQLPLATSYRFRVTQGAHVQTIDAQTNSFKFIQLASYADGTTYNIDVQVQIGGNWSDYGTAYTITTPINVPLTQISAQFRGITQTSIDSAITADPVPLATAYRFRVTQGASVQTINAQTNSFKIIELASYAYNTSYSIDVQAQISGNWGNYGTAYAVTTPVPITQISASFRGTTLAGIDSTITADPLPLATGYRFRVTQDANVQTIDKQNNAFKITQLASYAYDTSYSIDVQVQVGGSWGDYGIAYAVNTPSPITQISTSFRGKTLVSIDSAITADQLPLAGTYRFRITQGGTVQTIDAQTNSFKFTQLATYAYNTNYNIDIQAQAGGNWGDYGIAYAVTTPAPLTQISELFSDKTLLNVDSVITADPIPTATGYRFRVTKGAAVQTLDAPTNSFKMKDLNNYAYNTEYSMDVAVKTGATVNSFGPVSLVTTPVVPLTQLSAAYCGAVLTDVIGAVYADQLPLATAYRFKVTQGSNEQVLEETVSYGLLSKVSFYAYNSTYSVQVAAQVGGVWSDYGSACNVTTLANPITQLALNVCGTVLNTNGDFHADIIPTATNYRFRVTRGSNVQVLEYAAGGGRLSDLPDYTYNTDYTVDVAAKVAGVWTNYGAACIVTSHPPVTEVSANYFGKLLTTNDAQIYADNLPTATSYRFQIATNGQTDSLDEPTNFARLGAMPSYEFNTTYSVRVSALVNGVWTSYGAACNVTTPVLVPQISTEMCGTVLTTVYGEIHEDLIPATMFSFIITDGTHIDTLQSQVGSIRLSSVPFYNYNTVFTVQVAVLRNGVWSPYGPACNVTTTNAVLVTEVGSAYCGKVLTTNDGEIYADDLPLATAYKFKVTDGTNTDSLNASTSFVRLAALPFFAFNTTYSIRVSAMINGVWTGYGAVCNVTTPTPLTQISASYCGTVLPTWNAQIQADAVVFASAYQFRVTQGSNVQTILSATNNLRLSDVSSFAFNTPFTIEVAAKVGNALAAYGTACVVTTHAALTNSNLFTLTLSAGTLTPVFDAGTLAYTASVSNATTAIILTPRVADATATVKVNETTVISGSASGSIALDVGDNPIATVVTAQDGTTTKSYNVTVTRAKATQVITFNNLSTKIYGAMDFDPGATSNNTGISLIYSSSNTAVATIVNGQIHIIGTGTSNITASQIGDGTHYAAIDVVKQLTITKKVIMVTGTAASKNYGDADPALTYTFSPALITGDSFTGVLSRTAGENIGTYPINQNTLALSSNYALTYSSANLTIGTKAIAVTAAAKTKTYGDADPALTYTTDVALVTGDSFTGTLSRITGENIGNYAINQNTLALSSNYALTYAGANLTIGTKAIAVAAVTKSKTYGDADPALTYTFSPALITGDNITGSLSRTTGENIGNYAINQNTLALSNNYALTYTSANLTIGANTIAVTAIAKTKTYGDADPVLTYQITTGALVTGDSFTGALSRTAGESVNSYAINQGSLALSLNYALTYNGANLTIGTKAIAVTADAKSKTYGDADPALTYQITTGALVTGDSFTGSLSRTAGENVNTYPINQGSLALNSNYALTYNGANLTIGTKTIAVTADAKSKIFSDADPALTYTFTPALIGDDNFTGLLTRVTGENVGPYAVNQGSLAVSTNYTLNYTTANLTIGTKAIAVTADAKNKTYGDADPALTYQITTGALVTGDSFTGVLSRTAGENIGTYAIGQNTLALSNNYSLTYNAANLTVGQAIASMSLTNLNQTYDGTAKTVTINTTPAGLSGASVTYNGSSTAPTMVGNYNLIASLTNGNYTAPNVTGTLTITNAMSTAATLANASYVYDGTAKSLAVANLPTGATVTYTGNSQTTVGTYTVTAVVSQPNYNDQTLAATLTITNATSATATLASASYTYDGTVKSLVAANLPNNATVSYNGNGQLNAGTYTVTAMVKQAGFYDQVLTGTLNINPAPLTITANDQTRNYGTANPALTVSYNGFAGGDTQNNLATLPVAKITATITSAPGNYPIIVSGGAASNYNITYQSGTLTVAPLSITNVTGLTISTGTLTPLFSPAISNYTISVPVNVNLVSVTASFDPTASAAVNGAPISNGRASNQLVVNTGATLIPVIVTAQDGVTRVTYTITVSQAPPAAPVTANNILSPNGDGKNDGFVIKDIDLYPNNVLTIYDRAGRVVFTKKGYGNDWKGTVNNAQLAQGTYFYTIQLDPSDSLLQIVRGYITILKGR